MIAAGRIQHENNLTRMLALFARHDRERAQAQAHEQTDATAQTDAPVVENSSITDPNRSAYGWGNISSSLSEGVQTGWYTGKTVGSGVFYGLIGFVQQIADSASFGYENFGVSGFFSGLGHGVGAGMAEGAKSIYHHGWAQMKIAAQAYVSPELSPELAGTQIGNGLMVPIGAIGLVDGARITFKAPAMMESGLRHGANMLENSVAAAKNFIDDLDNNSPSGGVLVTNIGSLSSDAASLSAAIFWDRTPSGSNVALSVGNNDGSSGVADNVQQLIDEVDQVRREASRLYDEIDLWDALSSTERTNILDQAYTLARGWQHFYQRFFRLKNAGHALTEEQLGAMEIYLYNLDAVFKKIDRLNIQKPAPVSLTFFHEHIIVSNKLAHFFARTGRVPEATQLFISNARELRQFLLRAEKIFEARDMIGFFKEAMENIYQAIHVLPSPNATLVQYLICLVQREMFYILRQESCLPTQAVKRWKPILQLLEDKKFMTPEILEQFINVPENLVLDERFLNFPRPTDPTAIHPIDYFVELADLFDDVAAKHEELKPAALRMREFANQALAGSETTQ